MDKNFVLTVFFATFALTLIAISSGNAQVAQQVVEALAHVIH